MDEHERIRHLTLFQRLQTFALKCQSRPRLEAMVWAARSEPEIAVPHDILDRHPMLFATPSGTIDLATGRMRENRREDYLTKRCPWPYDPRATCPLWERALRTILGDDDELVTYVQKLTGYSMTGDVREQILPICHGGGSNGKSLVFEVMRRVLGQDYSGVGADELLRPDRERGHPTHLADLYGKRLVTLAETAEGGKLNEELVKKLTGGERISARRMKEDFWSFDPTHKLWIATNHRPAVGGTDDGIWRRLRLIPFHVRFWDRARGESGEARLEMDRNLLGKILPVEAPGILAWMVRGCLAWQREGLTEPARVTRSSNDYRASQDIVGNFIDECCSVGPAESCQASACYEAFKLWHQGTGQEGHPMSQTRFSPRLLLREGIEKRKASVMMFFGLSILPQSQWAGQ